MGRRRRRLRGQAARGTEFLEDSASGSFDPFAVDVEPLRGIPAGDDQYEDSIHTGLTDSRVPRPGSFRFRSSPWVRARATARSRSVPGRDIGKVVMGAPLFERALACAGRAIRREVLFAVGLRGKGSRARRRGWSFNSRWRC